MPKQNLITKYPIEWRKGKLGIKIFCSIPKIATGILISAGDNLFLVDPGDGILRDINKELTSEQMLSVSNIFVTHGHHDHVGGIWSLLTYWRVVHKLTPVNIYYPEGCVEIESIHRAFLSVYSKSISYKIHLKKISNNRELSAKNVKVKPFPVLHKEYVELHSKQKQVPALGYKFIYDGSSICYGGDTARCEPLVQMAKNSDLAILEAGLEEGEPDDGMHMSVEEAIQIGKTAKDFFLVHVPE